MSDNYECKFRCACGEGSFFVRHRNKDEDIVDWMEKIVRPAMGQAHFQKSPICSATACDLMLPISEAAVGIGMRTEH